MSRLKLDPRLRALLAADPSAQERMLYAFDKAATPGAVRCPSDLAACVRPFLHGRDTEALACVAVDRRRKVVDVAILTTGSEAYCLVDARQIMRWTLTRRRPASAVFLAHNHPSGDATPSAQDRDVTERVARAGRILGIPLLDHLVYSDEGWTSLAEQGCLPPWRDESVGWSS